MAPKMPQIDCKLEGCVAKLEKNLDPCFQKMTSKVQGEPMFCNPTYPQYFDVFSRVCYTYPQQTP